MLGQRPKTLTVSAFCSVLCQDQPFLPVSFHYEWLLDNRPPTETVSDGISEQ